LDSIFNQTYTGEIEVIVCDDNSTDASYEILHDYEAKGLIKLLHNSSNLGAAASRNRCIDIANGELIAILDADDYIAPNKLERQISALSEHPGYDFVSTGLRRFYENGVTADFVHHIEFPQKKDFLYGLPFLHATTVFKKSILQKVSGYRIAPETKRGQDYDLFMRIYATGGKGFNIPDILYHYRCFLGHNPRNKFKYRIDEAIIRYKGFKAMKINPIRSLPYIVKPIIAGLIPEKILRKYILRRRRKLNEQSV